ncbi:hypothetical protein LguiB_032783 [Lonicera macranthoides]
MSCYLLQGSGYGYLNKDDVEKLVRELMEGEKGKKMKNKALGWKEIAEKATSPGGSSSTSLENVLKKYIL